MDDGLQNILKDPLSTEEDILESCRQFHTHEINRGRKYFGEYHHLFHQLKKYPSKFYQYMRMSIPTFNYILYEVKPLLTKNWCNLHKNSAIKEEEQLVIALRFLATGQSYASLHFSFRVAESTLCELIPRTLDAIWKTFSPIHMKVPTKKEFTKIADAFFKKCGVPNCLGCIDGRHIRLRKPDGSGSLYYNYKHFYSITLQAIVDSCYRFLFIDVGAYGSQSDGGVFNNSEFKEALDEKLLDLPNDAALPGSTYKLPFYFIGDGAYALSERLMKPFRGHNLPKEKAIYNKKISGARVTVEDTFGHVCQKWRIFYTTIQTEPEVVELIVKCTCVLQNILVDLGDFNVNVLKLSVKPENTLLTTKNPKKLEKEEAPVGDAKKIQNYLASYFEAKVTENKKKKKQRIV